MNYSQIFSGLGLPLPSSASSKGIVYDYVAPRYFNYSVIDTVKRFVYWVNKRFKKNAATNTVAYKTVMCERRLHVAN